MAEYTPTYTIGLPLTLELLQAQVAELESMHAYATAHDDVLVLDELFCRIVSLEHRVILWEREHEHGPRVATSIKELNRALKWAWLARDEEDHAGGMYASKLKEGIAVLQDLAAFLDAVNRTAIPSPQSDGMTQEEAEALAVTIKFRLPQAEVEARAAEGGIVWEVEARNPRRGTSQVFHRRQEFEELVERTARK